MKTLNPRIVKKLAGNLKIAEKTVKNNVSNLARKYPGISPNAVAHIYALAQGNSVLGMLDKEDRASFPSLIPSSPSISSGFNPKNIRIVKIGKNDDSLFNRWWVQLLFAFLIVGVGAGTIAQLLATFIAKSLHWIN